MDCAGDAPLSQFDREVSKNTIGEDRTTCSSHLMNTVIIITAKQSSGIPCQIIQMLQKHYFQN